MLNIYQKYVLNNYNCKDIYESFAVEYLGWIQVSENGLKRVICRGERWQDKYIGPFINQNSFTLVIADNGHCHDYLFPNLYDNSKQITTSGLEKKYSNSTPKTR